MRHTRLTRGLTAPSAIGLGLCITMVACESSTSVADDSPGRIRVFNDVFQGASAAAAVPIAIDVLIDSSTATPGVANLANGTMSAGSAAGTGIGSTASSATLFPAAGYRDITFGLHTFQARKAGVTGNQSAFFRNANGSEYLPKQALTSFPYTCVVAGVVPPDGTAWSTAPISFCILASPDDPFTPPKDTLAGHSGLTARLRFVNAATFASNTGAGAALTFALAPSSATVSPVSITATAAFRAVSAYVNPPAGGWTLTISTAAGVIYTATVTFAAGEVRTIIVYSTAFAANPVGAGNHLILNTLDNKF
jgi:hypothetical protein